jgi:chromosome segregation protein
MYLKSIEIHGFKSFAVRIKFEFHNGITAIVGPNGSGKSNVADAVRWVLGEQRVKQLRGASMQDVIFAGTETRKPMGYAYVAITLDNSDHQLAVDYAEVTIARRLYRSGESEYLLNGTAVRLKDVSELFYDTGIGKEGYSIIGQGQIDKILSDRPEDRRELFDEAAGIVKFKRRKDEAVKKLTVEQDNLVRVTDILSELEKQIGPLEKQSEKAQVYLKAREEQKKLDVNLFLVENSKVHEKLKETVQQLEITGNDLTAARTEFDDTKTGYDEVQSEIEVLDKAIAEAREAITHTSVVRGQLEGSIKVAEEQIRAAKQNAEHFTVRRGSIGAEIDRVNAEKEKILSEKSGVDEKAADLTKSREEVSSRLDAVTASIQEKNEASESGKRSILQALEERSTIKSRLASLTTQEESINIRKSELTGKLVRAQSDKSEQDSAIAAAEKMFELVSGQVAELQHKKSEAETELAGMKSQLSSNDEKLQAAQIHFHEEQSRLDALKNLTERYEGFGGSVRRVMENKGRENGLIGVVADLIKTDEKYETAIEVALGGNIQNIVTKDEDTAKRMIDLLKREKAGRATFLPLSTIQNAQEFSAKDALHEPGAIGSRRYPGQKRMPPIAVWQRAFSEGSWWLTGFDHAAAIGRKYRHTVRLVTLEGELFVPGGAISGGAFQRGGNLLGRRREIAELEKKVAEYKAAAETAQQAITEIKTHRNELRSSLETLGGTIQQKLIEQNTARLNIARERDRQKEQTGSYEQLKNRRALPSRTRRKKSQNRRKRSRHGWPHPNRPKRKPTRRSRHCRKNCRSCVLRRRNSVLPWRSGTLNSERSVRRKNSSRKISTVSMKNWPVTKQN